MPSSAVYASCREKSELSVLLKSLDRNEDLPDEVEEEQEACAEEPGSTAYARAQSSLLTLLSPQLKLEYERLQPLDRYLDSGISKFSLLKGQCWVFSRALTLGWNRSLHEEIERSRLRYSHDRHDHTVERIGKKYQHIAFGELVGYLVDHHWYVDWNKEPRVLTQLAEFSRSDIDPTYLSGSLSKPARTYCPGIDTLTRNGICPRQPRKQHGMGKNVGRYSRPGTIPHSIGRSWTPMVYAA